MQGADQSSGPKHHGIQERWQLTAAKTVLAHHQSKGRKRKITSGMGGPDMRTTLLEVLGRLQNQPGGQACCVSDSDSSESLQGKPKGLFI